MLETCLRVSPCEAALLLHCSFVANEPGSLLEFVIDTEATTPGNHVTLRISYLASYERHGMARVQCVHGCSCADSQFNSLWERHNSQVRGRRSPFNCCRPGCS
jgi:hypothetical protein